jgi:hypothetical protein
VQLSLPNAITCNTLAKSTRFCCCRQHV